MILVSFFIYPEDCVDVGIVGVTLEALDLGGVLVA